MSRDVCGICWCPYDEDGKCGCKPVKVIDPAADEALLRQIENDLHMVRGGYGKVLHEKDKERLDKSIAAIKERLK